MPLLLMLMLMHPGVHVCHGLCILGVGTPSSPSPLVPPGIHSSTNPGTIFARPSQVPLACSSHTPRSFPSLVSSFLAQVLILLAFYMFGVLGRFMFGTHEALMSM